MSRRRLTVAPQADPSSLPDARMVNRLSSRLCRKKSKEKIEPDFNRSFSPFLSPPWPRSIAHKRLASMDSGYNQRHDFLSFNHFPEPVGEGEMEEEIVCNRWRDLAGEHNLGQCSFSIGQRYVPVSQVGKTLSTFPFSCWCSVGSYLSRFPPIQFLSLWPGEMEEEIVYERPLRQSGRRDHWVETAAGRY